MRKHVNCAVVPAQREPQSVDLHRDRFDVDSEEVEGVFQLDLPDVRLLPHPPLGPPRVLGDGSDRRLLGRGRLTAQEEQRSVNWSQVGRVGSILGYVLQKPGLDCPTVAAVVVTWM